MNYSGEKVNKELLNSGERVFIPSPNAKNYNKIEFSAKVIAEFILSALPEIK